MPLHFAIAAILHPGKKKEFRMKPTAGQLKHPHSWEMYDPYEFRQEMVKVAKEKEGDKI